MENIILTNRQIDFIMTNPATKGILKKQIPAKIAYWIERSLNKCESLHKSYINIRNEIVERYAKRDEEGNFVTKGNAVLWQEDKAEEANTEYIGLLDEENDLGIKMISVNLDSFGTFSVEEMAIISPLLDVVE